MGLPFEDPVRKTPKKAVLPERSNGDLVDKMGKGTAGPMNVQILEKSCLTPSVKRSKEKETELNGSKPYILVRFSL